MIHRRVTRQHRKVQSRDRAPREGLDAEGRPWLAYQLTRRGRPPMHVPGPPFLTGASPRGGDPTGGTCTRPAPSRRVHRHPVVPCASRSARDTGRRRRRPDTLENTPSPGRIRHAVACPDRWVAGIRRPRPSDRQMQTFTGRRSLPAQVGAGRFAIRATRRAWGWRDAQSELVDEYLVKRLKVYPRPPTARPSLSTTAKATNSQN